MGKYSVFQVETTVSVTAQIHFAVTGTAKEQKIPHLIQRKGERQMRIGVTYENGEIFQHFGHTEQFKLYDVENGEIKQTQVVDTNGQGHSHCQSHEPCPRNQKRQCTHSGMSLRACLKWLSL